jgi:hypothetical protein
MRKNIFILFLIIINLLPCYAAGECNDKDLNLLLEEYKELREKKGWFEGGHEWNKELDSWDGRFHTLMAELGEILGNSKYTEKDIINLMGEPDAIYREGDKKPPHIMEKEYKPGGYKDIDKEQLIYFWRGWHDYLYFVCQNGKVIYSDWYFAYE